MREKSMQKIENKYTPLKYRGERLQKVLENDKEYQKLLKKKKNGITTKQRISKQEKKKYVLATDLDFEILRKCKQLEKQKLTSDKKILVKLIKAQLEQDWRASLLKELNKLLKEK